jgi:hypothetical protein
MHFLTLLIIVFGFVLVICLGVAQVIWDLRETSAHASPHMPAAPHRLRVLIRAVSCNLERCFAAFADVPYNEPVSRQQWELLWRTGL